MKEEIVLSVIIPVYNVKPYLERCINSVIGQSYSNLEIILVDDGSTDGSEIICDEFAERDSRLKVIHKENGGVSSARNIGLDFAKGKLITFVDSDDWIHKCAYQYSIELLECYEADMVWFNVLSVNSYEETNTNEMIRDEKTTILNRKEALALLLSGEMAGNSVCNKIYKRKIFDNLRFEEGMILEDAAIMHQCLEYADNVVCTSRILYYYFQRYDSTLHSFSERTFDAVTAAKMRAEYFNIKYSDLAEKASITYIDNVFYLLWWSNHVNKGAYKIEREKISKEVLEYVKIHKDIKMPRKLKSKIHLLKLGLNIYDFFWDVYHMVIKKLGR